MLKQSLYKSVIDSHIENSENWNCEFSCRAHRHNARPIRAPQLNSQFQLPISINTFGANWSRIGQDMPFLYFWRWRPPIDTYIGDSCIYHHNKFGANRSRFGRVFWDTPFCVYFKMEADDILNFQKTVLFWTTSPLRCLFQSAHQIWCKLLKNWPRLAEDFTDFRSLTHFKNNVLSTDFTAHVKCILACSCIVFHCVLRATLCAFVCFVVRSCCLC